MSTGDPTEVQQYAAATLSKHDQAMEDLRAVLARKQSMTALEQEVAVAMCAALEQGLEEDATDLSLALAWPALQQALMTLGAVTYSDSLEKNWLSHVHAAQVDIRASSCR